MDQSVSRLDIELSASADKAAASIARLGSALGKLKGATTSLEPVKDDVEKVGESTQTATVHLGKFFDKLKSIIPETNKLTRSLSGVTKGFKLMGSGLSAATRGIAAYPRLLGGSLVNGVKRATDSFNTLFASI